MWPTSTVVRNPGLARRSTVSYRGRPLVRITVLGSGSSGNATLVEAGGTRILVDAGLRPRTVRKRARAALGITLGALDGIVVTHAHCDHAAHASSCGEVFGAPVYLSESTRRGIRFRHEPRVRVFGARAAFRIGAIDVHPLPVPHDAPNVALVFSHLGAKAGMVTDVGCVTHQLVDHLRGCSAVFVESNYDPHLLLHGPYPEEIQRRVRGGTGHLSNGQTAELLRALDRRTETVVLMHLSERNNLPELARDVATDALSKRGVTLRIANAVSPSVIDVRPRGQLALPHIA